jgi:hypothetical protein
MNKLLVGGAAAAVMIAAGPVAAQPAPPPPPGVASGTAPMAMPMPMARAPHARMMVMSDHVMTREAALKHVRELFTKLDANRDGVVTRAEVDALHQKMVSAMNLAGGMQKRLAEHGIMMGDRSAIFDRLDANHDGNISRQEFMAAQPQVRQERVMILRDGAGGPGMPGEMGMEHMKMHMRGAGMARGFGGHLFDMADVNHDGIITPDARRVLRHVRFERRDG